MGYVDRNLMTGEELVYRSRIHWVIFVPSCLYMVVGGAVIIHPQLLQTDWEFTPPLQLFGGLIVLIGVVKLIEAWIIRSSTELAVTTKRVIAKRGFIRRDTTELNHSKVEGYLVDQTILGRILNFGTLTITGTGGGRTPIRNVDDPLAFRRAAIAVIDVSA